MKKCVYILLLLVLGASPAYANSSTSSGMAAPKKAASNNSSKSSYNSRTGRTKAASSFDVITSHFGKGSSANMEEACDWAKEDAQSYGHGAGRTNFRVLSCKCKQFNSGLASETYRCKAAYRYDEQSADVPFEWRED